MLAEIVNCCVRKTYVLDGLIAVGGCGRLRFGRRRFAARVHPLEPIGRVRVRIVQPGDGLMAATVPMDAAAAADDAVGRGRSAAGRRCMCAGGAGEENDDGDDGAEEDVHESACRIGWKKGYGGILERVREQMRAAAQFVGSVVHAATRPPPPPTTTTTQFA